MVSSSLVDVYETEQLAFYYGSKRHQAAMFLMAMGAKALALWDISSQQVPNTTQHLDAEAALAHTMISHQFRVLLANGLSAQKRARNGRVRTVHLMLKASPAKGEYLEYPASGSLLFSKPKTFRLATLRRLERVDVGDGGARLLPPPAPSSSSSSSATSLPPPGAPSVHRSTDTATPPAITLVNDERRLTLQFESDDATSTFVDFVSTCYLRLPKR